jgi:hypothetical protein
MSKRSADKASSRAAKAAEFNPYNTNNLFGNVQFDQRTGNINQNLTPWAGNYASGLQDFIGSQMGRYTAPAMAFQQQGIGDIGGAYGALNQFGMPDQIAQQTLAGQQGLAGGMAGLFGQAMNNPYAMEQMQYGRNLLGSQAQSYDQVAADRLGLLREQAAPFEQRATDSLFGRMFSQGRMGSTGGGRDIESFARGLGQADTSRQLESQTFAEQLYGRDLNAALQRQGMGANMFGAGVGNYLQGLQGAGQLGGMAFDALGSTLGTATGYNQLGYSRAADRMARAEGLFGFGQQLEGAGLTAAQPALNQLGFLTGQQNQMLQQGMDAGGRQAAAGAQQAQYLNQTGASPFGGFLQGIGGGMMTGNIQNPFAGMFGGAAPSGGGGTGSYYGGGM